MPALSSPKRRNYAGFGRRNFEMKSKSSEEGISTTDKARSSDRSETDRDDKSFHSTTKLCHRAIVVVAA